MGLWGRVTSKKGEHRGGISTIPPADIMARVKAVHDEPDLMPSKEANKEPCPTFRPCPNTKVAHFDFQKEVEYLPHQAQSGRYSFG